MTTPNPLALARECGFVPTVVWGGEMRGMITESQLAAIIERAHAAGLKAGREAGLDQAAVICREQMGACISGPYTYDDAVRHCISAIKSLKDPTT